MRDARSAQWWARQVLQEAGIEEAGLEAEVLVRHALGLDRVEFYANPEASLGREQQRALQAFVARRAQREPLAYILGQWEFYGLSFQVTPAVLVPRPETETLVEEALRWIRGRGEEPRPLVIADIGAGSGCIAVSLAVHLPAARVLATDVSAAALEVTRANSSAHGVTDRVQLLPGDLLAPLSEPVDLLVANLPYIPNGQLPHLQPEIRCYEPSEALRGGPDGMALTRRLLREAPAHLHPCGALMLEMDPEQRQALERVARHIFPGASMRVVQDLAGLDRVLVVEPVA